MDRNWTPLQSPEEVQITADALSNLLKPRFRTKAERRARMAPDDRIIEAMTEVLDRTTPEGIQPPKEEERNDSGRRRGEWLGGE